MWAISARGSHSRENREAYEVGRQSFSFVNDRSLRWCQERCAANHGEHSGESHRRQRRYRSQCIDHGRSGGHRLLPHGAIRFSSNQLPFINPISQNLLPFYPRANSGPFTFVGTQLLTSNDDQFGIRLDQYLTEHDQMDFRYSFSSGAQKDPLSTAGANVPGFPVGQNQRAQNFVAQETHTFAPTLVGTLRFSFLRNKFLVDEHLNNTTPSSLGFQYAPSLAQAIGPPFIQVAGYASIGDPITGPRNTYQNSYDFSGSLTWIKGNHQFKFGGGYQYDQGFA